MKNDDSHISRILTWMYHILFLVTPLLFTWFNDELFEFNKMMFVYIIASVVGGVWIIRMLWQKKFTWKKTVFDIPLAIFLFSQLLSTLFSIHLRTSIFGYYSRFHGGLLSTVAYLVLFAVYTQTFSAKDSLRFLKTLAVGSLLVAAMAIPEHFGRSFSCVLINTSQLVETHPISVVFSPSQLWSSYNATCWIQDVQHRVFATFGQPNWLAAYVITLLPLFVALSGIRKKSDRWLFALASVAGFLSLLFTRSRSGILGWAVGAAWMVGILAIWWIQSQRSKTKGQNLYQNSQLRQIFLPIGAVLSMLFFCAVFFGTPYSPSLIDRISKKTESQQVAPAANRLEEGGTDSGQIRVIVWEGAVNVWKRYPFLGSGVETFAYSYYQDRPMAHNFVSEWDFLYNKAHNEFLNFLATTGLVGLISYVVLLATSIGFPLFIIFRRKNISVEQVLVLAALSSGLVALTVSNAFGFSTVMVAVLFFIFPAMTWHISQESSANFSEEAPAVSVKKASQELPELELRQLVWSAMTALLICVGIIIVWRSWRADYLFSLGKRLNEQNQYSLGITALEKAYSLSNGEGVFTEELAEMYSLLSAGFAESEQATAAAAFKEASLQKVDEMMMENPYNINFYKTKARILATLSTQDPATLEEAQRTLEKAVELAPTDPRVRYNLGLVKLSMNATASAQQEIERSIEMRPQYEDPRMSLAKIYIQQNELQKAVEQYRYILEKIQPKNDVARTEVERLEKLISTSSAKLKNPPVTTGTKQ